MPSLPGLWSQHSVCIAALDRLARELHGAAFRRQDARNGESADSHMNRRCLYFGVYIPADHEVAQFAGDFSSFHTTAQPLFWSYTNNRNSSLH